MNPEKIVRMAQAVLAGVLFIVLVALFLTAPGCSVAFGVRHHHVRRPMPCPWCNHDTVGARHDVAFCERTHRDKALSGLPCWCVQCDFEWR